MAVQLFILRGVPEDEAAEIRALLDNHRIDYYETPAGSWGMSMPALWLHDEDDLARARELLDDYQRQRQARMRDAYQVSQQAGMSPTVYTLFRRQPLRFLFYVALVAVVLYFSLSPFIGLGR